MQVSTVLIGCLSGRALGSACLAAAQHTALPLHTPWRPAHPGQPTDAGTSCSPGPSFLQTAHFTNSSHTCSSSQQQQQEPEASKSNESNSGGSEQQQRGPSIQQEAQQAGKSMFAKNFDMEELWFAAVGGNLKVWSARTHPDLKGREEEIVGQVQQAYYTTLQRAAAGHLLSSRSRSQMKQACLAAATYKTLVDAVPGCDAAAEQSIADLMGGLYAPFMLGGLRVSSWVKRLLLRQSSISQAVDTLHTIARDMEGACHCSVQPLSCGSDSEVDDAPAAQASAAAADQASAATAAADAFTTQEQLQQQQERWEKEQEKAEQEKEDEAEAQAAAEAAKQHHSQHQWQLGAALTVDSCLYAEVLEAEGVPQLLKAFCCQHNMSWLDTYSKQGVDSKLEACIAKGNGCCRITVTPVG